MSTFTKFALIFKNTCSPKLVKHKLGPKFAVRAAWSRVTMTQRFLSSKSNQRAPRTIASNSVFDELRVPGKPENHPAWVWFSHNHDIAIFIPSSTIADGG